MQWPDDTTLGENAGLLQPATRTFLKGCLHLGQRVWPFIKGGNSARSKLESEVWARRLETEKNSLLSLVRGMEAEFLITGEGLMSAARQLAEIQKECQVLAELTLGESEDAAVQFSFQLLKKAEDFVLASHEQYDHVFATFGELQRSLGQLSKRQDQILRALLPLTFITLAFRIEASRHPLEVQEAFFALADNVNRTVRGVCSTMERQFSELAVSERTAHVLMEQTAVAIQQHRKEVTATLQASRQHLRNLSDALMNSRGNTTDLAERNRAVSAHLNVMVMAQQCQDITRQRIEHVGEAMDEMRVHLGDSRPASRGKRPAAPDARPFVFRAGQIQLQQVQNVFDQLNEAAGSLKSGVQNLRTDSGAAAEAATQAATTVLDAEAVLQCQAGIDDILGIVKQAVQKIADIVAAFESFQASFVDCTGKATALAGDVRRAGLNAQIFAIHAPDGATLEVLAGRMHGISGDVIQQVEQMGADLACTSAMVAKLKNRLEDFQTLGQAEQEVLAVESARSKKNLSELKSAIPILLRGIVQRQERFGQSVKGVLANVRFPATVAEARPRFLAFFEELVTWSGQGGANEVGDSITAHKINRLHSNYTMESERRAHAATLSSNQASPAGSAVGRLGDHQTTLGKDAHSTVDLPKILAAAGSSSPLNSDQQGTGPRPQIPAAVASPELGDNVELF